MYTVTLEANGQQYVQQLEVRKDPNSEGTEADIRQQLAMVSELREDMNSAAEMVNSIEWIRRQVYDLKAVLADQDDTDEIISAADELDKKLIGVEENLLQMRTTGTGQDGVRWPAKLVGRLGYLAGIVSTADFPPTDQAREVHEVLRERLARYQNEMDELLRTDVPAFNGMLRDRQLAPVITTQP